jgi:hypothetical protein
MYDPNDRRPFTRRCTATPTLPLLPPPRRVPLRVLRKVHGEQETLREEEEGAKGRGEGLAHAITSTQSVPHPGCLGGRFDRRVNVVSVLCVVSGVVMWVGVLWLLNR